MIKRLGVTGIYVKDQNEALRFYTEKLGFEIRADVTMEGYRWLTVGVKGQPDLEIGLNPLTLGGSVNEEDVRLLSKLVEGGKLSGGVLNTDVCHKIYADLKTY